MRPEGWASFTKDRVCCDCGIRYSPPTPLWGGVLLILSGLFLTAIGAVSVVLRIASGNILAIPALIIEGMFAVVGVAAIRSGWSAFVQKQA